MEPRRTFREQLRAVLHFHAEAWVAGLVTSRLSFAFPQWQASFQRAILALQRECELAHSLAASSQGVSLVVCDRGTLDGAAYTPGGVAAFCALHDLNVQEELGRYDAVVHLQSLACVDTASFARASGADVRYEPAHEAARLDARTWEAWQQHPHHVQVPCSPDLDIKYAAVASTIDELLAAATRTIRATADAPGLTRRIVADR